MLVETEVEQGLHIRRLSLGLEAPHVFSESGELRLNFLQPQLLRFYHRLIIVMVRFEPSLCWKSHLLAVVGHSLELVGTVRQLPVCVGVALLLLGFGAGHYLVFLAGAIAARMGPIGDAQLYRARAGACFALCEQPLKLRVVVNEQLLLVVGECEAVGVFIPTFQLVHGYEGLEQLGEGCSSLQPDLFYAFASLDLHVHNFIGLSLQRTLPWRD